MKRFFPVMIFLFFVSGVLSAHWVSLGGIEGQGPGIRVLQDRGSSITVEFELEGYSIEDVVIDGITYSAIELPGQVTFLAKGFPELPTIARNIIIPDDALMDYRIVDIEFETRNVHTILPSKGNLYRNVNPEDVAYTFDVFYGQDNNWPQHTI